MYIYMSSVKKLRSFRRRNERLDVFSLRKNGSDLWADLEANVVNGFSVGNVTITTGVKLAEIFGQVSTLC